MKGIKLIILGAVAVFILSLLSRKLLFPTDILNYLQVFNYDSIKSVHNSLLADPAFQFEPWRIFAKATILRGELPLWNSYNAGGTPFLANPQTAIFYPINFIYYVLPAVPALNLITYLKLSLFGYFVFLYLRSIKISSGTSLLSAFIATFSAFPTMWIFWPHTNVFILFPYLLFLTEKLKEKNNSSKYLISLTYVIAILGGHPETLFHVGVLHVVYSFFSLRKQKKLFLYEIKYIFFGFLLSSFMLVPFIEYVLYSDLLNGRISNATGTFLPALGIVYSIFPFLFGSPNTIFYKVPFNNTNFQELAGGYVGTATLLISFLGAIRFRKKLLVKFLGFIILFLLGITYKIWPFWLVTAFPPVSAIANQRLVGFVGFFIVVLFAIVIDEWSKKVITKRNKSKMQKGLVAILILISGGVGIGVYALFFLRSQNSDFIFILSCVLAFYILSTFVYLFYMTFLKKRSHILFLSILVYFMQVTIFLAYNSFNSQSSYYPPTSFTNELKKMQDGRLLEVGNLIFPPNLNLAYGLSHVQGDDAIGVRVYSDKFKKTFPATNFWGRVDQVTQEQANAIGADYIVSDHDINLESKKIQPDILKITVPKNQITIPFRTENRVLSAVRIITANFNRKNTCMINLNIIEDTRLISQKKIQCQNVKDKMFLTIPVGAIQLKKSASYALSLSLGDANNMNSIGLWSNTIGVPYLELLYKKPGVFKKVWSADGLILFTNEHNKLVEGFDRYSIIKNEQTKFIVKGEVAHAAVIVIKKTNYPGWNVLLDGKKVEQKNNTFFEVSVESGEHLIEASYTPYSFFIGLLISFLAGIAMVLSFIKQMGTYSVPGSFKDINSPIRIGLIALLVSIVLYGLVFSFIQKFITFKDSGAINWLNLTHYPKKIDFVSVFSFFAINVFVFIFLLCTSYLRKKK